MEKSDQKKNNQIGRKPYKRPALEKINAKMSQAQGFALLQPPAAGGVLQSSSNVTGTGAFG